MWKTLPCSFPELNLEVTLCAGQSFRWNKSIKHEWHGVISGIVWTLKQDIDGNILYNVHDDSCKSISDSRPTKRQKLHQGNSEKCSVENYEQTLKEYFNLQVKLEDYYNMWCKADDNFRNVSIYLTGIRILRQDPVENLFSFICSANNNIPRIANMVEDLCLQFGEKICEVDGRPFHAFPTLESLANKDVEGKLRKLGFGYRAKYINQAAKFLLENRSSHWLESLRAVPYREAHSELLKLPGVGPKVADCICLMSLDKHEAIPVDTHIWQVTLRAYIPDLKTSKTLTNKIYQQIADFYRELFGEYAGWATTVLFASDLKQFKEKEK